MSLLTDALTRLLATEQALTASDFTVSQRRQLEHFAQTTRLLSIAKQGRSTIYRLVNRSGVVAYLALQQPLSDAELSPELPVRSRNIATDRDSKKGRSHHECWHMLMKAWDTGVYWQDERKCLAVAEHTQAFGVAALQITLGQAWQCNRSLLLIENQALFDRCDWLPEAFDGCLIYYAGQLSELFLQWLAEQKRSDQVILFPDYDGVGLTNYVRLADALPADTQLSFYWLPDWESKLAKFGNPTTWRNTRGQFENALAKLAANNRLTDELSRLAGLSQFYGKALEQESVWL